jgi:hypothetical protein
MYYPRIFLEWLSKTTRFSVGITAISAEIWTVELLNKSQWLDVIWYTGSNIPDEPVSSILKVNPNEINPN